MRWLRSYFGLWRFQWVQGVVNRLWDNHLPLLNVFLAVYTLAILAVPVAVWLGSAWLVFRAIGWP